MLFRFTMKNPTSMAQKSSVSWCPVRHMLFHFIMENPTEMTHKVRYHDAVNHTCDNTSLVKCLQTFAPIKVQSHNAVNDTRYLILFWEYPTQTLKKTRHHNAVFDTCYFILWWKIRHKWPKKARYHDAVYDTCYFISLWKSHIHGPKKLGTIMPEITHVTLLCSRNVYTCSSITKKGPIP